MEKIYIVEKHYYTLDGIFVEKTETAFFSNEENVLENLKQQNINNVDLSTLPITIKYTYGNQAKGNFYLNNIKIVSVAIDDNQYYKI